MEIQGTEAQGAADQGTGKRYEIPGDPLYGEPGIEEIEEEEIEGEDSSYSFYDYSSVRQADTPINVDLANYMHKQYIEQNRPSFGEVFSSAWDRSQTVPAIMDMIGRASTPVTEDFSLSEEVKADIELNYNRKETDFLLDSRSEQDYLNRVNKIKEEKKVDEVMSRAGLTGFATEIALSLFDPATLALGAGTGKIFSLGANAVRAGKSAQVAKVAIVSGLENAAIETVLTADNTQKTGTDILFAGATGALFGASSAGILAGASKVKKAFKEAEERSRVADVSDSLRESGRESGTKTAIEREYPGADVREAQAMQYEYRSNLEAKAKGRLSIEEVEVTKAELSAKEELLATERDRSSYIANSKEVRRAQSKVDSLNTKLKEAKKGKSGIRKKLKTADEELKAIKASKASDVDTTLKGKVKSLKTIELEVKELRAKLTDHEQSIQAIRDLKEWDSMSELERVKVVAPEGLNPIKKPTKRAETASTEPTASTASTKATMTEEELLDLIEQREANLDDEAVTIESKGNFNSVGAAGTARDTQPIYNITGDRKAVANKWEEIGENLNADLTGWYPTSGVGRQLYSIATRLLNSESKGIRGIASVLLDAPMGGSQSALTVAEQLSLNDKYIRAAGKGKLSESFDLLCESKGINTLNIKAREKELSKFNKAVFREVRNPGSERTNVHVQEAADAIKDQIKVAREMQKKANLNGADAMDLNDNFAPISLDYNRIKLKIAEHGEERVRNLISDSYRNTQGGAELTILVREQIANLHIAKAKNFGITLKDKVTADLTLEEALADLKEMLKDLPTEAFNEFTESIITSAKNQIRKTGAGLNPYIPNLIRKDGIDMADLIQNDLAQAMENFTKEASANVSFGQLGFKSREDFRMQVADVERAALDKGINPDKLREDITLIAKMEKAIYGEPIDSFSGKVRNRLSMARKVVAIRDLIFSGASQVAEVGVVTSKRSLDIVWDSMSLKELLAPSKLRGGKRLGTHERPDFAELDESFGFVGEDYALYDNRVANDLMDENVAKGTERRLSNVIDKGSRVSTIMSGMKNIQSGLEKVGLRSIAGTIKRMAFGESNKVLRPAEIKRAGWSDGFLENEVFPWMRENPKFETYNGREVRTFNFENMEPEMHQRLVAGIQRLAYADIQRSFLGELPEFMYGTVGKTIAQHRNFQVASLEKQLLYGIRHDKVALSMQALHTVFSASAAVALKTIHRRIGEGEGIDSILEDLDPTNPKYWFSILQNMGQFASLGIGFDLMYSLGALPEDWAKVGGLRTMSATTVPIVGYAGDLVNVPKSLFNLIQDEGETTGEGEGTKLLKALHRAIPGANAIGLNQALDVLERD